MKYPPNRRLEGDMAPHVHLRIGRADGRCPECPDSRRVFEIDREKWDELGNPVGSWDEIGAMAERNSAVLAQKDTCAEQHLDLLHDVFNAAGGDLVARVQIALHEAICGDDASSQRAALDRADFALGIIVNSESNDRHWFDEAVAAREQVRRALWGESE